VNRPNERDRGLEGGGGLTWSLSAPTGAREAISLSWSGGRIGGRTGASADDSEGEGQRAAGGRGVTAEVANKTGEQEDSARDHRERQVSLTGGPT
jgi:hypothetical protein